MHFDLILSTFVSGRAQRIQPFFPSIFWSGHVVNLLPSERQFPQYYSQLFFHLQLVLADLLSKHYCNHMLFMQ